MLLQIYWEKNFKKMKKNEIEFDISKIREYRENIEIMNLKEEIVLVKINISKLLECNLIFWVWKFNISFYFFGAKHSFNLKKFRKCFKELSSKSKELCFCKLDIDYFSIIVEYSKLNNFFKPKPLPEPSPEPLEAAFTVAVVLPKVGVVRLVNAVVSSEVSVQLKQEYHLMYTERVAVQGTVVAVSATHVIPAIAIIYVKSTDVKSFFNFKPDNTFNTIPFAVGFTDNLTSTFVPAVIIFLKVLFILLNIFYYYFCFFYYFSF